MNDLLLACHCLLLLRLCLYVCCPLFLSNIIWELFKCLFTHTHLLLLFFTPECSELTGFQLFAGIIHHVPLSDDSNAQWCTHNDFSLCSLSKWSTWSSTMGLYDIFLKRWISKNFLKKVKKQQSPRLIVFGFYCLPHRFYFPTHWKVVFNPSEKTIFTAAQNMLPV